MTIPDGVKHGQAWASPCLAFFLMFGEVSTSNDDTQGEQHAGNVRLSKLEAQYSTEKRKKGETAEGRK